ncbi:MAG: SIS domain-containing protein [Chloroflexi bacterium]|nr:SIS domain-containing protein [Chloroflexota bacterium]
MATDLKLLALDIDGVLTDGRTTLSASGEEVKQLYFHDLDGITALTRRGTPVVLVTGETGPLVKAIAGRLKLPVLEGRKDKLAAIQQLAADYDLTLDQICYVGDSDRDAPALRVVGLGLAPANASSAAKAAAHRVLSGFGGHGAVAEAIILVEQLSLNGNSTHGVHLRRIVEASIAAHQCLLDESLPVLGEVAQTFVRALRRGNKIMLFGNGGSAADAQHVAGELVGRFLKERNPLPAIALTTDSSILTAIANDWDFHDVFARQIRALTRPGDVAVGISTSGKSPNVLKALADARACGATTIGFTGAAGAAMRTAADICFCAPAHLTPRIQELHLLAWHAICEVVEETLLTDNR